MIRSEKLAEIIADKNRSLVDEAALHFDKFFEDNLVEALIERNGNMSVDCSEFLAHMRSQIQFKSHHDNEIISRFVDTLQEAGYIAEYVRPAMNDDYISIKVVK